MPFMHVRSAAVACALTALSTPEISAAQERLTLAVGAFANRTGDPSFAPLAKGLADMLVTDLAVADGLTLVERGRLQSIVDELKLSGTTLVDPTTAQRVGKLVGADLMLVGAFTAVEPTMRLDARLVTVETAEIIAVAKADGPAEKFFAVEASLVKKLLAAFGVALSPIQRLRVDKPPTRSLEALKRWSEALDAFDQKDESVAKQKLEAALAVDPTFRRAQQRLAALEAQLKALEARTSAIERAGGLVLKPTQPAEFWSNYRVYRQRKQTADARRALEGLLARDANAIDAVLAYANLAVEMGEGPDRAARMQTFAPRLSAGIAAAAFAIAAADSERALAATARLLAEARTPRHVWLRLQALGPAVNKRPTAEDKAEAVALLYEMDAQNHSAKIESLFVGQDSIDAARDYISARRAYYASGRFPRGAASLPGAALHFPSSSQVQLRIAEPSPRRVRLQLAGRKVFLKYVPVRGFRDEYAVFKTDPRRRGRQAWKTGLQPAKLRYVDGKGRPVEVAFTAWVPPTTVEGPRWPTIRLGFKHAPRAIRFWADPIAPIWATIPGAGVTFLPGREALPLASGSVIHDRRPQRFQSGFRRPFVTRSIDGALLSAGRAEFYWDEPAGDERPRVRHRLESLALENEAHLRPWHRYRIAHVFSLLTSGARREAIDLALDLTTYTVKDRPAPFGDTRGALMAAWQRQASGDYQWLYLLAAAKGIDHRWAALRATAAWLPRQPGYRALFSMALDYLDGKLTATALLDQARQLDGQKRKGSYAHRFLSEAATVVVLADPGWARSTAILDGVRTGAQAAHVNTWEWPILTAALRAVHLRDLPQVRVRKGHLDRWEVTADEFLACIRSGACDDIRRTACGGDKAFENPSSSVCWPVSPNDYPTTWVSRQQAKQYCAWRGGRLPRLREWRAATVSAPTFRSTQGNLIDAPGCTFIVFNKADNDRRCNDAIATANHADGWLGPAPRGVHPLGRTANGLEQVVGNVREWVEDGDNVSVGCSYADAPGSMIGQRCVERRRTETTMASGQIGFRCFYERPPARSAVAQAQRAPPKTKPTRPKLTYVTVPGGKIIDDYTKNQLADGPRISIEADSAGIEATSRRVLGLSKDALRRFLAALQAMRIRGDVPEHALQELVARGRLTGHSDQASLDLFLRYLEPPKAKSGKPLQQALAALASDAQQRLRISVYDSAYHKVAREKKKAVAELSVSDRRQAMFDWLMAGRGNRKHNLDDRKLTISAPVGGTASWWSRGCLAQSPGHCVDPTAGHESIDSPYPWRRSVTVKPFALMRTEVTQAAFEAVLGRRPATRRCDNCAVTQVGFADAQAFCKKVGARLPTEAEWRWAARGGRTIDAAIPSGFEEEVAFLWNSPSEQPTVATHRANPYGIHDILGGVWEWTTPANMPRRDYQRHVWGGSWRADPRAIHPDISVELHAELSRSDFIGFRCARTAR